MKNFIKEVIQEYWLELLGLCTLVPLVMLLASLIE